MICAVPSGLSMRKRFPLMYRVVDVGWSDCFSCRLVSPRANTEANLTMLTSAPPVICDVSTYLKSPRAGAVNTISKDTAQIARTAFMGVLLLPFDLFAASEEAGSAGILLPKLRF